MKLEELYTQKGELITQIEILQSQLKNVNIEIAKNLNKQDNQKKVIAETKKKE
jgi:hypothetical protein